MCRFFSLTSDGRGEIRYFDWTQRKRILDGEMNYNPDSHTSINDFFGYKGELEDCRNKYEYNPITGVFTVDAIHGEDDSAEVERKVRALDFSQIVPQLVIKPIKNPLFVERKHPEPSAEEISMLKRWSSVKASNWNSVMTSVRTSVMDSVWDLVGASVIASVKAPVMDSVMDSVWVSFGDSLGVSFRYLARDSLGVSFWYLARDSVWDSTMALVRAYISSFFVLDEWPVNGKIMRKNPLQPAIDLWESGLVPSFDEKVWRLHVGKNAQIVYEMKY